MVDASLMVTGSDILLIGNVEILREIVFDRRYHRLDELQEDDQIHVYAQFATTFLHGLDDLLHDVGVPTKEELRFE